MDNIIMELTERWGLTSLVRDDTKEQSINIVFAYHLSHPYEIRDKAFIDTQKKQFSENNPDYRMAVVKLGNITSRHLFGTFVCCIKADEPDNYVLCVDPTIEYTSEQLKILERLSDDLWNAGRMIHKGQ